jgi:hypothetical protein
VTTVYTTGTACLDAFIRAVRLAMPELQGRVIRSFQRQADAPQPDEPFAAVALVPLGPQGHPVIDYPCEAGTSTAPAAPYDIPQTVDAEHRAVVAVEIRGDDGLELMELMDSRICGEGPQAELRRAGVAWFPGPADIEDVTRLLGDRWAYALVRVYRIGWQRRDYLRAKGIDNVTAVTPTVT